tara:strand:- start:2455 stop:3483 length:1029 start_codon:yes stop_codon:yes gene_type:complete
MTITHTFIDFIPAIFLGAPDEDTALSIMPGHKFLIKGRGHEAVLLTLTGSIISIILLLFITPFFIFTIPKIYPFIQKMMAFLLILISIFLLSREKESKIWAFLIFVLAGFLGLATLNLNITQPLLPLLTGLFGTSTLIYSISQKLKIPKQKIGKLILSKKQLLKPAIATSLVSPICSFFPGLGSSQAAIIGSEIINQDRKQFMILLGSINTFVLSISFVTLFLIQKTRTGSASAISQLTTITPSTMIYIIITIILTAAISIPITIKISKIFAKKIHKINYTKISSITILFLILIIFIFTRFTGILILTAATFLGLTSIHLGIRRSFLMGSLLIPTILIYLPS